MNRLISTSLFLLLGISAVLSQNVTTEGKDFWLGFMENLSAPSPTLTLRISSKVSTSGTVSSPLAGWSQTFTVTPGAVTVITAPLSLMNAGNGIFNGGIRVVSADTVSVFASNYRSASFDATIALPVNSLGYEYRVLSYPPSHYTSQFMVVATDDNTQVEITPSQNTSSLIPSPANVPFVIVLNAGQVFQCQSVLDLSWSRVRSLNCKKIAVFAGNVCSNVPAACSYCDHLYEALYPVNAWGSNFVVFPFSGVNKKYTFKALASADTTVITVNTGKTIKNHIIYNSKLPLELELDSACLITGSKAIEVFQYAQGQNCAALGDPFMLHITPIEQGTNRLTFSSVATAAITRHYVAIVTRTANKSSVLLNGTSISASFTKLPADTSLSYASVACAAGSNVLTAGGNFNAYIYGFGNVESYGYSGGGNVKNLAAITSVCVNDSVKLTAPSGETYLWSTGATTAVIYVKPVVTTTYSVQVTANGCSSPVSYTVTVSPCPSAVALDIINLRLTGQGKQSRLAWTVNPAENAIEYIVERRNAGSGYEELGRVYAGRGDRGAWEYRFNDSNPPEGMSYYRVKQIKKTGSFNFSNELSVNTGIREAENEIMIFPNPAKRGGALKVSLPGNRKIQVSVYNFLGQKVHEMHHVCAKGLNELPGFPSVMLPGQYILEILSGDYLSRQRFIIE